MVPIDETNPTLLWLLRRAGDEWGPLGVALAAAQLSDPVVVVKQLLDVHETGEAPADVVDPVARMEREHPLDTLLRNMLAHGWGEDDPMVAWVSEAMRMPYPMSRCEARERGLLDA